MRMIDAVDHGGVLVCSDAERLDRDVNTVNTDVVLAESGGIRRRPRVKAVGIQTIDSRERSEFIIEGMVFVENDKYVLHFLLKQLDHFDFGTGSGLSKGP